MTAIEQTASTKITIKPEYQNFVQHQTSADYKAMKESIRESGQHVPAILNEQGVLIDGHHRYKACQELGIPLKYEIKHFDNELDEILFMYEINDKRRHYSAFQRGEMALLMKPRLEQIAKRNMSLAGKGVKDFTRLGRVDKQVAETAGGQSHMQIYKIGQIVKSPLFRENEEFRQKCRTDRMSIEHAHTMVKQLEERDKPKPAPPEGHYNVILVDPPWSYIVPGRCDPKNHYGVMSDEEIKALRIPAADNAILFLWATNPKLDIAIDTLRAWGFTYKTNFAWFKDKFGTGYYNRGQHELLLIGVKGKGIGVPFQADRSSSVFFAERTEHSKKPEVVYEMIEKMYPGRKYLEMFARGKPYNEKWTVWGLEAQ
jgi:N6-adenosine-specific RNA methylase IME4